jgi:hypothetical protein
MALGGTASHKESFRGGKGLSKQRPAGRSCRAMEVPVRASGLLQGLGAVRARARLGITLLTRPSFVQPSDVRMAVHCTGTMAHIYGSHPCFPASISPLANHVPSLYRWFCSFSCPSRKRFARAVPAGGLLRVHAPQERFIGPAQQDQACLQCRQG